MINRKGKTMQFHEYAMLLPMLSSDEKITLKKHIQENGLLNPIVLYEGKILDGRNRYEICLELGITPTTKEYSGDNPLAYVVGQNIERRHLSPSQKAAIAVKLEPLFAEENKKKEKQRKLSLPGNRTSANLHLSNVKASTRASKVTGASVRNVQHAKRILKIAPETFKEIEKGSKTINQAINEIAKIEVRAKLDSVAVQEVKKTAGKFDVIVIDPPWPLDFFPRESAPNQVSLNYPVMTLKEIENLTIPSSDDCHVFLWTTHKFLPFSFEILKKYGAEYKCTFVWHKNGGFQVVGMPQMNCEFCLYGQIGKPKFVDYKSFNVCFDADRGKHSEKPQEFYDLLNRVTAGRKIDMFNRREIKGFSVYGNQTKEIECPVKIQEVKIA